MLHACEVFDRLYHFTISPATARVNGSSVLALLFDASQN
jgi:hypothetical protein